MNSETSHAARAHGPSDPPMGKDHLPRPGHHQPARDHPAFTVMRCLGEGVRFWRRLHHRHRTHGRQGVHVHRHGDSRLQQRRGGCDIESVEQRPQCRLLHLPTAHGRGLECWTRRVFKCTHTDVECNSVHRLQPHCWRRIPVHGPEPPLQLLWNPKIFEQGNPSNWSLHSIWSRYVHTRHNHSGRTVDQDRDEHHVECRGVFQGAYEWWGIDHHGLQRDGGNRVWRQYSRQPSRVCRLLSPVEKSTCGIKNRRSGPTIGKNRDGDSVDSSG